MHHRFDHVGKQILRGALAPGGVVENQLEVPAADAQAIDTFFEPDPGREAERHRIGLVGRMAEGPTMFEPFRDPPGLEEMRACFRKQLALDHRRVLDARKSAESNLGRPGFPRLWVLSTGRPKTVLRAYDLAPMADFPPGFYAGAEADARGVVVLQELPRERETLILRLMGADGVLREVLAELGRLPADAWERAVAVPPLVEARFEIPQDVGDEGEREFLMSTRGLYEEWRQKTEQAGVERGVERTLKRNLLEVYETRFGAVPADLRAAIDATHDEPTLDAWFKLALTRSVDEIAAAIRASRPS